MLGLTLIIKALFPYNVAFGEKNEPILKQNKFVRSLKK